MENNRLYVIALMVFSILGVAGILLATTVVDPTSSSIAVGHILVFLSPIIGTILILLRQNSQEKKIGGIEGKQDELYMKINSRLDELLRVAKEVAYAAGVAAEKLEQQKREKEQEAKEQANAVKGHES